MMNSATRLSPQRESEARRVGTRYLQVAEWLTYLLIALAIIRFWIAPLGSSFWRDEAATAWTVKDGLAQMFSKLQDWPNISPAYGIVAWLAYQAGGLREYALRLPSLIAICGATLMIYRSAKLLTGAQSGVPAAVLFLCSEPVIFAGADARPYALQLLAISASTFFLIRWLASGSRLDGVAYVLTAALIVHAHYLGFPVLAVHAAYAVARLADGSAVRRGVLLAAAVSIGVLLLPLVPTLAGMYPNRQAHAYAGQPGFLELAHELASPVLLCGIVVGIVLAMFACGGLGAAFYKTSRATLVLMVGLSVGPVLLLFAASRLTPTSVFVPRYFLALQVGQALLGGWIMGGLRPPVARWLVTACVLAYSIATFGEVRHLQTTHGHEDWRAAMAAVRQAAGDSALPVVVQSGFIESSRQTVDLAHPPGFIVAPLTIYPARGHVLIFPFLLEEKSRNYVESAIAPTLENSKRFILVTCLGEHWPDWFLGRFPRYTTSSLGNFEAVKVTLFAAENSTAR